MTVLEKNTSLTYLRYPYSKFVFFSRTILCIPLKSEFLAVSLIYSLGSNNLGPEAGKAIATALEKNTSLEGLW